MPDLVLGLLILVDGVHRKAACAIQPEFVLGAVEEFQKRVTVAARAVAAVDADAAVVEAAQRIEAVLALADGAEGEVVGVGDVQVPVDVFEVPGEGLALEVLTEGRPGSNAEKRIKYIVLFCVFVPSLSFIIIIKIGLLLSSLGFFLLSFPIQLIE